MKKLIPILLIALALSSFAIAQSVKAPSSVEISPESKQFSVKVSNDSDKLQNLSISLSSPIDYAIEPTPTSLLSYSSQNFTIKLSPTKEQSNQTIQSTLLVRIGDSETKKKIETIIGDFAKKKASTGTTGFFALPSLANWEQIADWILIIVIIVLVIAIIARLARRKKQEELQ